MNWKNRLWQFFLAIVVGATLSVCNSAMDTNNFEAIAGSISDGSDQGYMRIGNMQIVWGKDGIPDTSFSFPKSFPSKPVVHFDCGGGTWTTTTMTNNSGDCNPYGFFAIGKWR